MVGQQFELVDLRNAWSEDRAYFHVEDGSLRRIPTSWTDLVEPDVHIVLGAGRADFRADDLLRLASLIRDLAP
jgi:hypothetical protein